MKMNTSNLLTPMALMILVLPFISCKEEFPPYTEPANVLQGDLTITSPDTVDVFYDGLSQTWFVNTPLILKVSVTNVHDNLLQGEARINGRVIIQSFAQIPRTMVVQLATGNLRVPPVFQGNIAIGPGAKAEFSEIWVPYAIDGSFVIDGLSYVTVGSDRIYSPITFIASADVQLFERVQPIRFGRLEFTGVFRQRG